MNTHDTDEFLESPENITAQESPAPGKSRAAEQEEIFFRAINGGGYWKGKDGQQHKLEPFSFQRRLAAQTMGWSLAKLTPDEIESLNATGYYSGIVTDAIIVTWLCLQPASEAIKASRLPELAYNKALSWAERECVEPGNPQFEAALKFFGEEISSLNKAKGDLKPADGKKPKQGKKPGRR